MGFSVFLPDIYTPTYVNGDLYGNTIVEWHSEQPGSQAPFHFGVNGANNQYFIDLHTAATGWSPIFSKDCGAIKKGQWVDFVVRHKWRKETTGSSSSGSTARSFTPTTGAPGERSRSCTPRSACTAERQLHERPLHRRAQGRNESTR